MSDYPEGWFQQQETPANKFPVPLEAQNIIRDLISVMEMQELRERGDFHITSSVAKDVWDNAKLNAKNYLER